MPNHPDQAGQSLPARSRWGKSVRRLDPVRLGAHIDLRNPAQDLAAAKAAGFDHVQIFLGDPQGWAKPEIPDGLAAASAQTGVGLYVHAPYVINVATTNNRIRIPSRKLLAQQIHAATSVGALGLIVHGGHVTKDDEPSAGFANWKKAVDQIEFTLPVFIENTAGGEHSMARSLESIRTLWDHVGHSPVGFCLDTCHAWAAGIELTNAVASVKSITGRVDLVHCNNSRDDFASGRDRHANLADGNIPVDQVAAVVRDAQAPIILETAAEGHASDIALLKSEVK